MGIPERSRQAIEQDREKQRDSLKAKIVLWYADNSGGKVPTQQCEDRKAYRGKVIWYLEPPVPCMKNPVMIEEFIGDIWSLRVEYAWL